MHTPKEILTKYWGYESFRPVQEDIVKDVVSGRDVFALLPTGGGKSICYQIPGILREGVTIVISPLISLMQDQIKQLTDRNINAMAICSGMSYREIDIALDNVRFGSYDFLYVSPERLQTAIFIERFKQMNVGLIVVDEAHCISQWGHDFRPSYTEIHKLREWKPDVPMAAFTATANAKTRNDIATFLKLKEHVVHEASFERTNLAYRIFRSKAKERRIIEFCSSVKNSCGIIYCQTRRSVKEVYRLMSSEGFSCAMYHGGLSGEERGKAMNEWMREKARIMVATNAFGMGIDKGNVRYVIHYQMSDSIEAYFQEAGRAGRDGKKAIALCFVSDKDLKELQTLPDKKFPDIQGIKEVYSSLCSLLKLAYGSGKEEVFPFDLSLLVSKLKTDYISVYNALHLLELNGMISLSEGVFQSTRVKIKANMSELDIFRNGNRSFDGIIDQLVRGYPGIFDLFKKVDLPAMSAQLKVEQKIIMEQLEKLHKLEIIEYIAASSLPYVTFLRERPPNDEFSLHPDVYSRRKEKYKEQIQHVLHLIEGKSCASHYVISYFDQSSSTCGQCVSCMQNEKPIHNANSLLLDFCKEKTTPSRLMNQTALSEDRINAFIDRAEHEELIQLDGIWIQRAD